MLIWLASYPRSGNTYVRIILNNVFGIKTYSLYPMGDNRVFLARKGVAEFVGHETDGLTGQELIEEAQASSALYVIKTHEKPLTDDPAIVIIRDGRSALVSYYHYCRDVEGLSVTLNDVIQGNVYAGSWSDHLDSWIQPNQARPTLILRYENITKDLRTLIEALKRFCKIEPKHSFEASFSEQNAMFPEFFRKGDDQANIAEMVEYSQAFSDYHGAAMKKFGYL